MNRTAAQVSELQTLLRIIAGTTQQLEDIWDGNHGSEKYLSMLRASVERAANITTQLIEHADGFEPEHPSEALAVSVMPAAVEFPKPPRLLVVDDEPAALLLFQRILRAAGYEVVPAESGCECLDRLSGDGHFDLVILDYAMPFMDGEETFRRIRNIMPELPVLLSTGFIHQDRLNRMLADGLAAFLRKPLAPDELVECVAGLLPAAKSESSEARGIAAAL